MDADGRRCQLQVNVLHRVKGDLPYTHRHVEPGVHDAIVNPQGAVTVLTEDGERLGLRPAEFEWVPVTPGDWTLYVAGPMRGFERYNFPAFDAAADHLRGLGFGVISPAEIDRAYGSTETIPPSSITPIMAREFIRRDVAVVCAQAAGLALLPNWRGSRGAKVEVALAEYLGIPAMNVGMWRSLPTTGKERGA